MQMQILYGLATLTVVWMRYVEHPRRVVIVVVRGRNDRGVGLERWKLPHFLPFRFSCLVSVELFRIEPISRHGVLVTADMGRVGPLGTILFAPARLVVGNCFWVSRATAERLSGRSTLNFSWFVRSVPVSGGFSGPGAFLIYSGTWHCGEWPRVLATSRLVLGVRLEHDIIIILRNVGFTPWVAAMVECLVVIGVLLVGPAPAIVWSVTRCVAVVTRVTRICWGGHCSCFVVELVQIQPIVNIEVVSRMEHYCEW